MEKNGFEYPKEAQMYSFTHQKLGTEGSDKVKTDLIIHEVGSEFYKKQQKQEQALRIEQRVKSMKNEILVHTNKGPSYIELINEQTDTRINEIELGRILTETWIHIDMDRFYAPLETRGDPSLANQLGNSMISTANYSAINMQKDSGLEALYPGLLEKSSAKILFLLRLILINIISKETR
jgi:hypothetical protein